MSTPRKIDATLQSLLHDLASTDELACHNLAAFDARQSKIAALQDSYQRMQRTRLSHFKSGDLVQWQPGLKYTKFPEYGEAMVVVEVLEQAVFDEHTSCASPYFRSPLSLVLGKLHKGVFCCWHLDGRRFELAKP